MNFRQGRRVTAGLALAVASATAAVALAAGGHGVSAAAHKRRPDLVVRSVGAPPGFARPGAAMTIRDRVANAGAARAGKFSVAYYLTRKAPAARVTIGTRKVSSLRSHKTSSGRTTVHLPLKLASSSYRLTACADYSAKVAESHERNNCLTAPGNVRVDGFRPTSTAQAPVLRRTTPIRVGYTANGTGSPLSRVELWVRTPGSTSFAKAATDTSPAASGRGFNYVAPSDGDYAFYTRAYDRAGNAETAPGTPDAATLLDSHPPTSAASAPSVTSSPSISVAYTASDPGSGLAKVELYVRRPGDSGFSLAQTDGSPADSGQSFAYTATAGDGAYAFYTRAYDNAGNVQPAPAAADAATTLDTAAPNVSLSEPADGSSTDLLSLSGSGGTAAGDAGSVTVKIYSGPSASGTPAQTLNAGITAGRWSVTAAPYSPGTYTARAEQMDEAGNVGKSATSTFTVPVSFLAAGDIAPGIQPDRENGDLATAALITGHAGTVATLGDNAYDNGTLEQFNDWYDTAWGGFRSRTFPALGNREYNTTGAAGYFDYFEGTGTTTGPFGDRDKGYYSYDVGDWHVIALNTNTQCSTISCAAGHAQETWLRADLAAHGNACTLAYFHHPLFSSSGTNSAVRPLWQALYDGGADVILNGHQHNYERFAPQKPDGTADADHGIREFVVGTGGRSHQAFPSTTTFAANSEARNDQTYGVLDLTLTATGYSWKFLPIAGQTFTDQGSGACHSAP